MKAVVVEIQVCGGPLTYSLEDASAILLNEVKNGTDRVKIHFTIKLPNGEVKHITIRDVDAETVAYGDFEDLPSILDWAKELPNA